MSNIIGNITAESTRKRMNKLLGFVRFIPYVEWPKFERTMFILMLNVKGGKNEKKIVLNTLKSLGSYHTLSLAGAVDIISFFIIDENREMQNIVESLTSLIQVKKVSSSLVTEQLLNTENIFHK